MSLEMGDAGVQDDNLLARYMSLLLGSGGGKHGAATGEQDEDVRTCARCGERVAFSRAGMGGWAACSACGELA